MPDLKVKTFKMDQDTESHLVLLSRQDDRSQAAVVRHLINAEWERRQLRRIRAGFHDDPIAAESDAAPASH